MRLALIEGDNEHYISVMFIYRYLFTCIHPADGAPPNRCSEVIIVGVFGITITMEQSHR